MKLIIIIQLLLILSQVTCKSGDLLINGSVISQKQFEAQKLVANSIFVQNMIQENNTCSAKNVFSEEIVTNEITVSRIIVTSENGHLQLNGDITIESLEVSDNLEITSFASMNQWQLAYHDHFEDKQSLMGWNINQLQICSKQSNNEQNNSNNNNDNEIDQDYFLGGHCVGPSDLKLMKQYTDLPKHKNLKIQATVHFFDQWEGETLSLFIDDKIAWTKVVENNQSNINVCGGESSDPHYGMPVEINIPHMESSVNLRFESNLQKDRCIASFAIDDVEIYVK